MKGLFIPGITAEMFRSGCLESIESLISEDEIFNIDYNPRHIPAIRDKLWEIQRCSNCILKPEKKIVEIKPQWIPTAERLPEEKVEVLVTVEVDGKKYIENGILSGVNHGQWETIYDRYEIDVYGRNRNSKIVAWMESPKPYGGE